MPAAIYQQLLKKYASRYQLLNRQLGWLSIARVIVFGGLVVFVYLWLNRGQPGFLYAALVSIGVFLLLVRLYDVLKARSDYQQALAEVNRIEMGFIDKGTTGFDNGGEYTDPRHAYSYDLDLFGDRSLFAFLNRTTTLFGKRRLADSLLAQDTLLIRQRQEAIKELSGKLEFRQNLQAAGSVHAVKEDELGKLYEWLQAGPAFRRNEIYFLSLALPLATLSALSIYFFNESERILNVFYGLVTVNLLLTFSFARALKKQMSVSSAVTKVLQQYAEQLKLIEAEAFQSHLAKQWQSELGFDATPASGAIHQLATRFKYLDLMLNLAVSIILNGLFLFHVHVLFALDKWKRKHRDDTRKWLSIIGQFEEINCFANFSFNNPSFCFPALSERETIEAREIGHPLIPAEKRVNNDIDFSKEKFVVLTGSNMSGKSTFLRALGVNIVLARAGSAVCASHFVFFPFELHVSMRISDSLQDSESLFYAELKRLREIIDHLQDSRRTFVILDEILRGTNSQDKHNGTIGLIHKLSGLQSFGIIATHDLLIADLKNEFPGYIGNQCFESVIEDEELVFDYKLKQGVCSRLNASFLMKRMGIIDQVRSS